ncbi:MAG: tRNA lysidine(34) synthetase TilS [Anaerolineales bacterium]|jgi:tRNA(Ile)-lysidine synthase
MLDNIANILQRECQLKPRNLVLVGVSGGPDSLFLLHVLHDLGYQIIAAHVNHGLRPEADDESQTVKLFAAELGVDFISCQVDVLSYVSEYSVSIEEAARIVRYQYLFEQAESTGASAVLVGHNADDQVETIMMHLLRGSGLAGLRGMEYRTIPNAWSKQIPLVRPLLSTWREDIQQYLIEHGLNPIVDRSNLDIAFFRNRLRLELIPILERYNPRVRENLLRVGHILRDDYEVLQQLVSEAWETNLTKEGPGYLAFRLTGFQELSLSIQRYLLRKAIAYHLPGLRDVEFECIDRGIGLLTESKPYAQVDLIAGLRIIKEGEIFWLTNWRADLPGFDFPALAPGMELVINIPSTISLNNNWNLQVQEVLDSDLAIQQSITNLDPFQAWVDAGELELPIIVRCRKAGERFQLLGMNGHSKKVSDLMINLKLPKRARSTWPIVCSGNDILWIPGCRMSHKARIKSNSRLIVHFTLSRGSST